MERGEREREEVVGKCKKLSSGLEEFEHSLVVFLQRKAVIQGETFIKHIIIRHLYKQKY